MLKNRGRRLIVATVTAVAVIVLLTPFDPPPIEAQGHGGRCRTDWRLESRTRRLTGSVMVECGDECISVACHSAPFGNWGVDSVFDERYDGAQFRGWWLGDGHRQWNSCTDQYYDGPYVNDGYGRQRAAPDNAEVSGGETTWSTLACASITPEVRTFRNLTMRLYELDSDGDDHVTNLRYGTVDLQINCSDAWNCSGQTEWLQQLVTDSTGVSADARISVRTRFVSY